MGDRFSKCRGASRAGTLPDQRISDFGRITNMKKILTNTILIAVSAGVLLEQTIAQPMVHEMRNDEQVIRISASNLRSFTCEPISNRVSSRRCDLFQTRSARSHSSATSSAVMAMRRCQER